MPLYRTQIKKGVTFMGLIEIRDSYHELSKAIKEWRRSRKTRPKKKKDKRSSLEREISAATETLEDMCPWSPEYTTAANNIEMLARAQAEMDEAKAKQHPTAPAAKVDINTILTVGGSLAALGAVIWSQMDHEDGGLGVILPTKELGFVPRIGRK